MGDAVTVTLTRGEESLGVSTPPDIDTVAFNTRATARKAIDKICGELKS